MTKRASRAGFAAKKELPSVAAPAASVTVPEVQDDAQAPADERLGQTLRLSGEASRQLKRLAFGQDKPAHDLLVEAVNMMFQSMISRQLHRKKQATELA